MKLDHIQIAMPSGGEDDARSFFSGLLGMVEEDKPYPLSTRGGCWFRKGSVIIHVGVDKDFVPQKKGHPGFIFPDLKELERKLKKEGYDVIWDNALADRTRFYSNDPFGNRIEFMQDGDGFSQK